MALKRQQYRQTFYQWTLTPFFVVQVNVTQAVAKQMFRIDNLDNIGPARWASSGDLLNLLNSTNSGIVELFTIAIR